MKAKPLIHVTALLLLYLLFPSVVSGAEQAEQHPSGTAVIKPAADDERPASAIARKLEKLFAVADSRQLSGNARIDAIIETHGRLFAGERNRPLDGVTDTDLDLLFKAASEIEFYTGETVHAREMKRLFDELEVRGLADDKHRADMHGALIHTRMFDLARVFERAHPSQGLEKLPKFRQAANAGNGGPTTWTVSPDSRLLTAQPVSLQGPTIVVVSHPTCHFSRGAVAAISDDAVLGPLFAQHAQWLIPPSRRLDFELMQQWNQEHPGAQVSLAVERDDWPMIDNWASTPTFYFFKDGELAAKVTGWPLDGAGRRDEVIAALDEIGLLE